MFAAYHVTRAENIGSIMKDGLVPAIGERSEKLGEQTPAVYLFTSLENMDNALWNWLGEEFEEENEAAGFEIERVALEVMLDDSLYIDPDEFYEIEVTDTIPPENIRVMSADEYSI